MPSPHLGNVCEELQAAYQAEAAVHDAEAAFAVDYIASSPAELWQRF